MSRTISSRRSATLAVGVCLLLSLTAVPARVLPKEKERWFRADSEHFTFFGNAGERRTTEIARQLERLRFVLSQTTRNMAVESSLPTMIYVFKHDSSFEPYKRLPDGGVMNVSGYFSRTFDGNYVAIDASLGPRVIFHEYLHAFLEQNVPGLPLWLNEGMAEFYTTFEAAGDFAEIGRHIEDHLSWLSREGTMPLDALFRVDTESPDYNEGQRQGTFYAQSWAMAHFLLAGDEQRRDGVGLYFELLERGEEPVEALLAALETDLPSLEKAFGDYLRRKRFNFYRFRFSEDIDTGEVEITPLDYPEVLFRLGDLLAHRPPVVREAAEAHLRAALQRRPEDARVHVSLAGLHDLEEDYDGALPLYRKAIELDGKDPHALARFGWSIVRQFSAGQSGKAHRSTPPELIEARELFRRSLELRPDHGDTLYGLGKTYFAETTAPEPGIEALTRASQLLPSRHEILVELIALLSLADRASEARSLLDKALRRRTDDAAMLRFAEDAVIEAEFRDAVEIYNEGRTDEAETMMHAIVESTQDPRLKAKIKTRVASLLGGEAPSGDVVDLYNRAIGAANRGELEQAIELLERVVADEQGAPLRDAAEAALADIRRVHHRNTLVRLYNQGVEHNSAGRTAEAIRLFEQVLEMDPDEDLRQRVEKVLADLKRDKRRRR